MKAGPQTFPSLHGYISGYQHFGCVLPYASHGEGKNYYRRVLTSKETNLDGICC